MDPQNKPTSNDLDKLLPIAHVEHKEVFNAGNIAKFIAVIIAVLIVITSIATVFLVSSLKSKIDQKQQVKLANNTTKSQSTILKKDTTNPDSTTANWKTYRNEKYGFEVKHPIGLTVNEYNDFSKVKSEDFILLFGQITITPVYPSNWNGFGIWISRKQYKTEELNRNEKTKGYQKTNLDKVSYSPTTFFNFQANRSFPLSQSGYGIDPPISLIFNKDNYGWHLSYPATDYKGNSEKVYETMLSTFKFIDQNQTDETANSDNGQVLAAAKKSCESYIYKQDIQRCTNPVVENIIGNYALIKVSNVRILLKKTENNWEFSTASDMSQNPDFCSTGTDNPAITEYCKSR